MLGLIGLIIATLSSKQWKIAMQDRQICCPSTFSLAPQWPPTFFILEAPLFRTVFKPWADRGVILHIRVCARGRPTARQAKPTARQAKSYGPQTLYKLWLHGPPIVVYFMNLPSLQHFLLHTF